MAEVEGRIANNPPAADDLTFDEVLEQRLPLCNDDPFDVADWLNERLRRGKIRLMADGIPVPPDRCATELAIVAKIASDRRATLEVVSRLDDAMARIGNTIDAMGNRLIAPARKAHRWTVERKSFEANRPDAPRNRGGRPDKQPPPRPPDNAPAIEHVVWAVRFLRFTDADKLAGLRGKKLQKLVCNTVGSNFQCDPRTVQRGKKRADSM